MSEERMDLVIHNARVWPEKSIAKARAIAVRGGRVAAIGGDTEILALAYSETQVVDGLGRPVLPGFVDAHVHLLGYAETFFGVDCSPSRATSIATLQSLIRERVEDAPPGQWVRAFGYHQFYLDEGRHPTRWDLDGAAPRNPVRLLHQNRHLCILNSVALRKAGISRQTPAPPGGLIDKDPQTGEPTGLLVGMYQWLSQHVVPPLALEEMRKGVALASRSFLSQGVTCIHDASPRNGLDEWRLYGDLVKSGHLPVRVRMMVGREGLEAALGDGFGPRHGDARLRLGAVKVIVEQIGDSLYPRPKVLAEQVQKAHRAGFQLAIHAIAPRAIRAAARAIRTLGDGEAMKRRHRLEHCTYLSADLVKELGDLGAVVVAQPSFIFFNGSRYLAEVPPGKFGWVCRGHSLLRKGVPLVGSTDCPVVPNSALAGIGAAASRESQIGFVFGPREAISAARAVDMFTTGGAYAGFEEDEMGAIEVGNLADFVILDRNPLDVHPAEIRTIRPEITIVGGKVAWMTEA